MDFQAMSVNIQGRFRTVAPALGISLLANVPAPALAQGIILDEIQERPRRISRVFHFLKRNRRSSPVRLRLARDSRQTRGESPKRMAQAYEGTLPETKLKITKSTKASQRKPRSVMKK
jgi:hypothetical protein